MTPPGSLFQPAKRWRSSGGALLSLCCLLRNLSVCCFQEAGSHAVASSVTRLEWHHMQLRLRGGSNKKGDGDAFSRVDSDIGSAGRWGRKSERKKEWGPPPDYDSKASARRGAGNEIVKELDLDSDEDDDVEMGSRDSRWEEERTPAPTSRNREADQVKTSIGHRASRNHAAGVESSGLRSARSERDDTPEPQPSIMDVNAVLSGLRTLNESNIEELLNNDGVRDEKDILKLQLLVAQAEINRLKAKVVSLANPKGLYFEEGVQIDLPLALLDGWTLYYSAPYSAKTTTDDILGEELGSFVLMGARRRNSSSIAVAAMGRRSVALAETETTQEAHYENGVYFYRFWNTVGFSDTPDISLNDCDVAQPDNEKKVSWFVDTFPGYRAGTHMGLYNDPNWEKVLYYA